MVAKGCDSHRCRWEQNAIYVVLWRHGDVVEYAGLIRLEPWENVNGQSGKYDDYHRKIRFQPPLIESLNLQTGCLTFTAHHEMLFIIL